eukprot:5595265-Prymnesium_polylepis.1
MPPRSVWHRGVPRDALARLPLTLRRREAAASSRQRGPLPLCPFPRPRRAMLTAPACRDTDKTAED